MKKTNFTANQIGKVIQEHEGGRKSEEICRKLSISTAAFNKWRQRDSSMEVGELKRLKEP